jgi:hypothetical protein
MREQMSANAKTADRGAGRDEPTRS